MWGGGRVEKDRCGGGGRVEKDRSGGGGVQEGCNHVRLIRKKKRTKTLN
jgi:hypothetical protein